MRPDELNDKFINSAVFNAEGGVVNVSWRCPVCDNNIASIQLSEADIMMIGGTKDMIKQSILPSILHNLTRYIPLPYFIRSIIGTAATSSAKKFLQGTKLENLSEEDKRKLITTAWSRVQGNICKQCGEFVCSNCYNMESGACKKCAP